MSDYREVLQNPRLAFRASDLQTANVKQSPLGLPLLVSGGFALTACLTANNNGNSSKFAIRCFHKEVPDLQDRYRYISEFLKRFNTNFFVDFTYEPEGIKVHGSWYPILRMAWVEGVSLSEYIDINIKNQLSLEILANQIRQIASTLNQIKVAHGDLQHGNIIIRPDGSPILIDYDGAYVYGMPFAASNETGHASFQHPGRNSSFYNEKIDNFSLIVIYVSLLALASQGQQLWQRYRDSEKLIFGKEDYKNPSKSRVFLDLCNDSKVGELVKRIQFLCTCPVEKIPTLEQFLDKNYCLPTTSSLPSSQTSSLSTDVSKKTSVIMQGQYDFFDADDIKNLINQQGNKITIVGRVSSARIVPINNGEIAFINFGYLGKGISINGITYNSFSALIFSNRLKIWREKRTESIESLKDKFVQITGLLDTHPKENLSVTPQIILEDPFQLKITTEDENKQSLGLYSVPYKASCKPGKVLQPIIIKPKPLQASSSTISLPKQASTIPHKPIPPKPIPPKQAAAIPPTVPAPSNVKASSPSFYSSNTSKLPSANISISTPNQQNSNYINKNTTKDTGQNTEASNDTDESFGSILIDIAGAAVGSIYRFFGARKK